MKKLIGALALAAVVLTGCGGAAGSYSEYEKVREFGVENPSFANEEEFNDFASDACGQSTEVLADRISGNSADQRDFYLVLRSACGEEVADKAWFAADLSDWNRENHPSEEYDAVVNWEES